MATVRSPWGKGNNSHDRWFKNQWSEGGEKLSDFGTETLVAGNEYYDQYGAYMGGDNTAEKNIRIIRRNEWVKITSDEKHSFGHFYYVESDWKIIAEMLSKSTLLSRQPFLLQNDGFGTETTNKIITALKNNLFKNNGFINNKECGLCYIEDLYENAFSNNSQHPDQIFFATDHQGRARAVCDNKYNFISIVFHENYHLKFHHNMHFSGDTPFGLKKEIEARVYGEIDTSNFQNTTPNYQNEILQYISDAFDSWNYQLEIDRISSVQEKEQDRTEYDSFKKVITDFLTKNGYELPPTKIQR